MRDWARAPRLVGGSWRKDRGSPRRLGPLLFLFLNSWKLRFRLPAPAMKFREDLAPLCLES